MPPSAMPNRVHVVSHGPHCLDGVAAAVATRLAGTRSLDGLTLIVGGIPVAYDSDAQITLKAADPSHRATADRSPIRRA